MDKVDIIFKAIQIIPKFLPKKTPPVVDYTELIESIPRPASHVATPVSVAAPSLPTPIKQIEPPGDHAVEDSGTQQTSCIPCSRSHLATVSGALGESLRFAREGGIAHPEALRRITLAEDEINIMERIDLSADSLAKSPPEDKALAEEYLPKIRELRQDIGAISSVDELEAVAAQASVLGQEFRLRHLQMKGVDLNPLVELAKKVESGELTMEEAKARVDELIGKEG